MLKLKDILPVCVLDWLQVGRAVIRVRDHTDISAYFDFEVKEITGFDDGLTVELFYGSSPCENLPVEKRGRDRCK